MDNPTHNMRGSQRALKMLNAQLQQNKAAAAAAAGAPPPSNVAAVSARPAWPPKSTSSSGIGPLDTISSTARPSSVFASFGGAAALLRQQEQKRDSPAVPLVSTPVSRRVQHNYSSPEASVPSNGGVKFHCDNSVGMLDLETSQISTIAGNNSNFEFSNLGGASQPFHEHSNLDRSQTNRHATSSTGVGVAQRAEEPESVEDHEARTSMCFSLGDGKVTSLVATSDGAYCIAGFSSGAIRLFDLTKEGNMDAEDRFGYRIGFIESQRGSVQVQLELGSAVRGVGGCEVDCCHLFAGARQGSTTMLAIDIGSLREVHKKRGFISMAGGGVQTLAHSDARLKGMTALCTLSATAPRRSLLPRSQQSHSHSQQEASTGPLEPPKGYVTTYRMITGRGFGAFHVWEVTLEARELSSVVGSPAASGPVTGVSMRYTQKWSHLYQGAVNGPTMNFASFVRPLLHAPVASASAAGGALSLWGQCQQRALLESSLSSGGSKVEKGPSPSTSTHVIVSDTHKDLRLVGLTATPPVLSGEDLTVGAAAATAGQWASTGKPSPLKDTTGTFAASEDGCILFGGKYELIVSFLNASAAPSASSHVAFRAVFSLSDFMSGAVGRSSKKTSRHLREISDAWCTPDGAYALILCTDNAVLLYSVCDITSKSSYPTRTEGGPAVYNAPAASGPGLNSGAGFLTYLFEAEETVNLDLGIAYAYSGSDRNERHNASHNIVSHGHSAACGCGVHSTHTGPGTRSYEAHHLPPENVLINIGWWLIENPMLGGVLRVCRLKLPSSPVPASNHSSAVGSGARSTAHFQHVVPLPITTSALILDEKDTAGGASSRQRRAAESCNCALCGYVSSKHWSDEDLTETEKTLFANHSSASSGSLAQIVSEAAPRATVERRERPQKKKEPRRESDSNLAGASEKKQKLSHLNQRDVQDRSTSDPDWVPHSRDTSFTAPSPANEDAEGEEDEEGSGTESSPVDVSGETEDDLRCSPTVDVVTVQKKISRPAPHTSVAPSEPNTAKELRQELDRLRVENRRLKDDTDLTMRKADRRFEMEMAARRFWKQEKNKLEGVIAQLQKDQQRFTVEREKVKRVHSLLQSVLETASDTLQYTDETADATAQGRASRTAIPIDAELQSPASKFQSDLTEVAQAHGSTTFTGVSSTSRAKSGVRSKRDEDNRAQQANFARKPFFCIVCLEHTARVAIQPCGHICFCPDHAQEMERRAHDHHHSKCPLCQAKIEGFLTIQGIDA